MLQSLLALVSKWWDWLIAALGIGALVSWLPGGGFATTILGAIATAAASILQMLAPVVSALFSGLIWVWSYVLLPGLKNILSNGSSIATVLLLGGALWFGLTARYEIKQARDHRALNKCYSQLQKAPVKDKEDDVDLSLPWPFKWR